MKRLAVFGVLIGVFMLVTAGLGCNGEKLPPVTVPDTLIVWDTLYAIDTLVVIDTVVVTETITEWDTITKWVSLFDTVVVTPIAVGWGKHFYKDTVIVGDTMVTQTFSRLMARDVGYWLDTLIVADSVGLFGFVAKDSFVVVDRIPFYSPIKHKQYEKRFKIPEGGD